MKRKNILKYIVIVTIFFAFMVKVVAIENESFEQMLDSLLDESVAQIDTDRLELELKKKNLILLDAREKEEFEVSHLKDAKWIGFDDFSIDRVKNINKDSEIVVYCSVGKRSENILKKLKENGFANVRNYRGGIFDWVNNDNLVESKFGVTRSVHPYNASWGRWLDSDVDKKTDKKFEEKLINSR